MPARNWRSPLKERSKNRQHPNGVRPNIVFAGASAAGFPEENMHIQGLDELPLEPIETVVPLRGVRVSERMTIGRVHLLPASSGAKAIRHFTTASAESLATFEQADSYALNLQTARRLYDAERKALAEINIAICWLTVRARYGLMRLPGGQPLRFDRSATRSLPRALAPVAVRGLRSQRRWLSDPEIGRPHPDLETSDFLWPPLEDGISLIDREAILAGRRAAEDGDPVQRVGALWEAWEYYAGDIQTASVFSEHELRRLRKDLPDWLTDAQRQRVQQTLDLVGGTPLMRRIRLALERDRVPFGDDDWALLRRLRKARNRTVHGASAPSITTEDLARGCGLLSRALTHRMAGRASLPL